MRAYCELRLNDGSTSGEPLLTKLVSLLEISGGMSSSTGVVDDEGNVSVSFDPETAKDGVTGLLFYLDSLTIEYELRFYRWTD